MSLINVEALRATPLIQEFKIKRNRLHLEGIRPWLYLHNDPAGTFTLTLKDGANILDSVDFTVSDLKNGAGFADNQYHKGYFDLRLNAILHHDRLYTLELSSSGYAFAGSSYLGWIKEFENLTNSFNEIIWTFNQKPFGYQLWGY